MLGDVERVISWSAAVAIAIGSVLICTVGNVAYPFGALHLPVLALVIGLGHFALKRSWTLGIRVALGADALGQMLLLALSGAIAPYGIAALTSGWADDRIAALDTAMGFDWPAMFRFMGEHPTLGLISNNLYMSVFFTPLIFILWAAAQGRAFVLRRLVVAYAISLAATLLVFALLPVRTALGHYHLTTALYLPVVTADQDMLISQLRSGAMRTIDPEHLVGLINFPSFHAIHGVLFIWASATVPRLRWLMLAINGPMLLTIPIEGSHFLADVLAGIAIAVAAAMVAEHVLMGARGSTAANPQMAVA